MPEFLQSLVTSSRCSSMSTRLASALRARADSNSPTADSETPTCRKNTNAAQHSVTHGALSTVDRTSQTAAVERSREHGRR